MRFPNDCPWDSQPRPRRVGCHSFAFDCAFSSPRRGRSLFKVVSSCRKCVLRSSQRTLRETGATRATKSPKTERGNSESNEFALKLHPCQGIASRLAIARGICARFSAFGGRRPLHNARRTLCARSTGDLPRNSARAGFAYSRLSGIPDNENYQEITVIRKVGFAPSGFGRGDPRLTPVSVG